MCVTGVLDEPRDREPHPNTVPTEQGLSGLTGSSRPQGAGPPVGQGWVGHRDRQEGEPGSAPMRQDNCLFPVLDSHFRVTAKPLVLFRVCPSRLQQPGRARTTQAALPSQEGPPTSSCRTSNPCLGTTLSALTSDAPCGRAGWPTGVWAGLRATLRFERSGYREVGEPQGRTPGQRVATEDPGSLCCISQQPGTACDRVRQAVSDRRCVCAYRCLWTRERECVRA